MLVRVHVTSAPRIDRPGGRLAGASRGTGRDRRPDR
jgi:hypothetical protein